MEVWVVPFARVTRDGRKRYYDPDVAVFDNKEAADYAFERISISGNLYEVSPPKKVKVLKAV